MEFALTFGSIGDIIALCHVVYRFGQAMKDATAICTEYQDLRTDLEGFVRILMQVVATYEQHDNSVFMNELGRVSRDVVNQCGDLILQEINRLEARYGDYIRAQGSQSKVKRAYKMLEMSLREKESFCNLQDKLRMNTERLSLLTALAAQRSARVDSATLRARIEEVHSLLDPLQQGQAKMLHLLKTHEATAQLQTSTLDDVKRQLNVQAQNCGTLLKYAQSSTAMLVELKDMMTDVSRNVIRLQFQASDAMFFEGPNPTRGLPVYSRIEDPRVP
ncbi:hypothetical protein VMCG_07055 [Cytospora schulzeri]|uniref:Fungal N-terminal domain-containing protein n=1 Tax=Cytospora schulzeri TaxID=448051 RepID=A0A423W413_9PEZI|nr:hypothetical protein VMCG_07055 [Valsa malicola]